VLSTRSVPDICIVPYLLWIFEIGFFVIFISNVCLVDLSSWQAKVADDSGGDQSVEECEIETVDTVSSTWMQQQQQQLYDGGILTIGCCGM